jgi:hypothetical protein
MNSTKINNEEANLAFDGMKLFIQNHTTAVDTIKSSWVINKKRFFVKVQKPSSGTQKPAPIDVQVIFNNTSKDTSGKYVFPGDTVLNSKTGKKTVVTPFKFVNITADTTRRKIPLVVIADEGNTTSPTFNSRWDIGEPLLIQTPQPWRTSGVAVYMCEVKIGVDTINNKDTLNFAGGDVYQVITQQPFAGANSVTYGQTKDIYEYTTVAGKFDAKKASLALDEIKVVPNPYVAVNDIEPNDRLAGATRGSRRIYFEHLPARATIRIYTLSGELVRTLEHDAGISNDREYWDLLNRDNLGVAYGVYLAHVDAPGVGEKILKFAIIK